MAFVTQNRHALADLCPPFLRGPQARSFLNEGIFTLYDIDAEWYYQSLFARFPTFAPSDALPYLAAGVGVLSGPYEGDEAKRARIRGWLNEAVSAGLPIGWLIALQAFAAPNYPKVQVVNKASTWYTLEAGAVPRLLELAGSTPLPPCPYESGPSWPIGATASPIERLRCSGLYSRHQASPANFDWDSISNPERVGCWWDCVGIIFGGYVAQGVYGGSWLFDDPLESIGFDEPYGTFTALRYITVARKSAKSVLRAIVWTPILTDFNPLAPPGDPGLPDGRMGWSGYLDGGVLVPTGKPEWRTILQFPGG